MLNTINLGGKDRSILFGNTVFRKLKRDTDKTSSEVCLEISKGDFSSMADVVYYALHAGSEYLRKEPDDFTVDQVSMWLDTDLAAMKNVIRFFTDSIYTASGNEIPVDHEDETKKKKMKS